MADIFDVADTIGRMTSGLEEEILDLLDKNRADAVRIIHEQLYSGIDGEGQHLSPTYLTDPYFNELDPKDRWYQNGYGYMQWKENITPPERGNMLDTPPRPKEVPNLFIDGTFYSEIFAKRDGDVFSVSVSGGGNGPAIVEKYGDQILQIGDTGVKYFASEILEPGIWDFFESCGW